MKKHFNRIKKGLPAGVIGTIGLVVIIAAIQIGQVFCPLWLMALTVVVFSYFSGMEQSE